MVDGNSTQEVEYSSDTLPAQAKGLRRLAAKGRTAASACLLPLMQRAARSYVGGETLEDALCVARRFAAEGIPSTLGYWNALEESSRQVADEYLRSLDRLVVEGLDSYLSIKPPALHFDHELAIELATAAQERGIRLHCDSHGLEVADPSCAMLETMSQRLSADKLSTTLPGRWSRSLTDADWVVDRGFKARIVTGQWPDPAEPNRDRGLGYLEVIDRLSARASHVAVASHNLSLAKEAMSRLRAAGASCELELLFGMPLKRMLPWALENGVSTRIYVPYGKGYLPYAIHQLRRNPRIAWLIIKDLMTFKRPRAPR